MSDRDGDWVGRTQSVDGVIAAWPAAALTATLDLDTGPPLEGEALPPMWHWLYFLDTPRQSRLGPEGHARRGDFLPPIDQPRRMFAGGRTRFLGPLLVGEAARLVRTIDRVEEKTGRSGRLTFVTVRIEVTCGDRPVLIEEQDLVYRDAGSDSPPPGTLPIPEAPWTRTVIPDSRLLFRFSALTFNTHRIHYDHPYVVEVEGYPGTLVHGPLTALLLLDLARRHDSRPVLEYEFRGRSPLFCGEPLTLSGGPVDEDRAEMAAWAGDGRLGMTAEIRFER